MWRKWTKIDLKYNYGASGNGQIDFLPTKLLHKQWEERRSTVGNDENILVEKTCRDHQSNSHMRKSIQEMLKHFTSRKSLPTIKRDQ